MTSNRLDSLYADSLKLKNRANRDAVQYIINCGEVNASDTIRDDSTKTANDYEWLAIATIADCLCFGEYNQHVVKFFASRNIKY